MLRDNLVILNKMLIIKVSSLGTTGQLMWKNSSKMIVLVVVLALALGAASASASAEEAQFSAKLYHEISQAKSDENIIISPASIKSCLGLAYMGAEGVAAQELHDVLNLDGDTKEEVGQLFGDYMKKIDSSGAELKTANRVYLADRYDIAPSYNQLIMKYFGTQAENVDFEKPETINTINSWIEDQTNKKIKEMIAPGSFDGTTSAILINAIYFKATWKYQFSEDETIDKSFHINSDHETPVKTMHQTVKINYGGFPELNATGIELPYDKTDIRMLVLLPNEIDGLARLEDQLKDVDVAKLSFTKSKVNLQFPKFKIEFATSLNGVLQNLGLKNLLNGDYSSLTTTKEPLTISEVSHKAFIEVDEQGTEAAAVTDIVMTRTLPAPRELPIEFHVDHPFYFAIKDDDTIYFAGHISKL